MAVLIGCTEDNQASSDHVRSSVESGGSIGVSMDVMLVRERARRRPRTTTLPRDEDR